METLKLDTLPPELMVELQDRADRAAKGVRDPEIMRKARKRMDRMRDEFRLRNGDVNLAVELIRECRDKVR